MATRKRRGLNRPSPPPDPQAGAGQAAEPREIGKRLSLIVGWVLTAVGIIVPAWSTFYMSLNGNEIAERTVIVAEGQLQLAREAAKRETAKPVVRLGGEQDGSQPVIVKDPNDINRAFVVIDGRLFELKDPRGLPDPRPDIPTISTQLDPLSEVVQNPTKTPIWPFVVGGAITGIGAIVVGIAVTRRRASTSTEPENSLMETEAANEPSEAAGVTDKPVDTENSTDSA